MNVQRKIELLAPAANYEVGVVAIDAGADAVYIGGDMFSARSSAGNSVVDIGRLVEYGRGFGVRVYLALNTMFEGEGELAQARELALSAIGVGVNGVIFQDVRVLDMGLPVELHASTQVCMEGVERAVEFAGAGVSRIVLERGLGLEDIREISAAVGEGVELECFVHGAICVGSSGVCYLSEHLAGRSGNRGECAQPCRSRYDLVDGGGRVLLRDRELLSPRDLNLSGRLGELIEVGVSSLKVEGRLKGADYVANVVGYYNRELERMGVGRTSWGRSRAVGYNPRLECSFNRGFTEWYLDGVGKRGEERGGRGADVGGEFVGVVEGSSGRGVVEARLNAGVVIGNGDGLGYRDRNGRVQGFRVNRAEGGRLFVQGEVTGIGGGEKLYRNHSVSFRPHNSRKIEITVTVCDGRITAQDEYGHTAQVPMGDTEAAQNPQRAIAVLHDGLKKSGGTIFEVKNVVVTENAEIPFLRAAQVNQLRRELLENLHTACTTDAQNIAAHPPLCKTSSTRVQNITGDWLLKTRYCILGENGMCAKGKNTKGYTLHNNGRVLNLEFDCAVCQMKIKR